MNIFKNLKVITFSLLLFISTTSIAAFVDIDGNLDKVETIKQMYKEAQDVGDTHEIGVLRRYSHPLLRKLIDKYERQAQDNEVCSETGAYGFKLISGNGYGLDDVRESFFYDDRADRVIAKMRFDDNEEIQVWYELACDKHECKIIDISHEEGADSVRENVEEACR